MRLEHLIKSFSFVIYAFILVSIVSLSLVHYISVYLKVNSIRFEKREKKTWKRKTLLIKIQQVHRFW